MIKYSHVQAWIPGRSTGVKSEGHQWDPWYQSALLGWATLSLGFIYLLSVFVFFDSFFEKQKLSKSAVKNNLVLLGLSSLFPHDECFTSDVQWSSDDAVVRQSWYPDIVRCQECTSEIPITSGSLSGSSVCSWFDFQGQNMNEKATTYWDNGLNCSVLCFL